MSTTREYALGLESKMFYGTANAGGTTTVLPTTELKEVKGDVTVTQEMGDADVTTRGNNGYRAYAPTLQELSFTVTMNFNPGNANFAALQTAYLNRTPLAFFLDNDGNGNGIVSDFHIFSFTVSQPLEDAVSVELSCKNCGTPVQVKNGTVSTAGV